MVVVLSSRLWCSCIFMQLVGGVFVIKQLIGGVLGCFRLLVVVWL